MSFPVGFYEFNKDEGLNFQLNRFYSSGFLGYDELMDIGRKVTSFEVWIELFTTLAKQAEEAGDVKKAAICYRAAQFYTLSDAVDADGHLLKKVLYEKCISCYESMYKNVEGLEYIRIPYDTGYLPVYYMIQTGKSRGTIVIHGGYDSFAQEFLGVLVYFNQKGYDVYFFEGPGQGEVLNRCGIKMTHEWEHCTSAILDFFKLDHVTLIGISLGGYLATRAAAYEPRISKLIMYDLIYDFYGSLIAKMGKVKGKFFELLMKHPNWKIWNKIERKFDTIYFTKWLLKQGYSVYEDVHTPYEYFNCIKKYNTREISSMITQDTLVLAGASDIYTVFYKQQIEALNHAKSVTGRIFTKEEHANHHCQIGNMGLVLDVMTKWMEEVENG